MFRTLDVTDVNGSDGTPSGSRPRRAHVEALEIAVASYRPFARRRERKQEEKRETATATATRRTARWLV